MHQPVSATTVTVYRQRGRWAATPANYGIWSWGDEIVVGFALGALEPGGGFHARDRGQPVVAMQARSLDGGQTWLAAPTPCRTPGDRGTFSADEHMLPHLGAGDALRNGLANLPAPCPGVDFADPDFALMCARTGLGAGTVSWFYTSRDRCRRWDGPFGLPAFGLAGVEARTDYLTSGSDECTLFLTASRDSGGEGRGVFCARTTDGGRTFGLVSWVVECAEGYAIMPASVRLPTGRVLVAVRRAGAGPSAERRHWIDLYASDDDCRTWSYLGRPAEDTGLGGNPPALTRLRDGRLCLVYGYRRQPYAMVARLSGDGGATWGEAVILRANAGNHDIGYPRTVQRADGRLVTVYWFNDDPAGERYVAATLWEA